MPKPVSIFPLHLGPYDIKLLARSGHQQLSRQSDEVESDMASGPVTSLNLAIRSFLLSIWTARWMTPIARNVLTLLMIRKMNFDRWLNNHPHAADGAAAFFFVLTKPTYALPDGAIVNTHWTRRGP